MLKISKIQGFVWKTLKRGWMAKVVFLIQMLPIFGGPLQSLLLRYTAENSQVANFNTALSACANKIELFSHLPKVDHVIKSCMESITTEV